MNLQFPYSHDYFPPAPVVRIRLGYPGENLTVGPLMALIDTGADGTLIPLTHLDALAAPFVDHVRIRSHWGEWESVELFTVDLEIDGIRLPAIEVVGDPSGDEIVLGRNVLNSMVLLLDGREKRVEVVNASYA